MREKENEIEDFTKAADTQKMQVGEMNRGR